MYNNYIFYFFFIFIFISGYNAGSYACHNSDFDNVIKTLFISKPSELADEQGGMWTIVCNNLGEAAAAEGCKVLQSKVAYFVRDAKVRTPNGIILRTTDDVENVKKALLRSFNKEEHLRNNHMLCVHPEILRFMALTREPLLKKDSFISVFLMDSQIVPELIIMIDKLEKNLPHQL